MNVNQELADIFDRMGKLQQLLGANRFRVIAYERGAQALENLSEDIRDYADDLNGLMDIDGIGEGLALKIKEYLDTGKMEAYDDLVAQVPRGVVELLDIPGLGPKTVATLWKQGGVEDVESLKKGIADGSLEGLPRIGKKSLDKIRKAIDFRETAGGRVRIDQALPVATRLVDILSRVEGVHRIDYAGSLRRGRETIGDIDLLCSCDAPEKVAQTFRAIDGVEEVLLSGQTKTSVRIRRGLQVDLRIVRDDQYGAALMYFTGSKEHNVALRERAIDRDLRLNEYGLWQADDADQDDAEPVAAREEADIYQALDLALIPAEMRERRGEIEAAESGNLPALIALGDIQAELHAHTTASDGHLSIEDLAAEARDRGYHTIAVTDHSRSQIQANGLDAERLEAHIQRIRQANDTVAGITVLAGTEVDILSDGKLDYPNSLLKELDIVVASPHAALQQDTKTCTRRIRKAIDNPYVQIIGHATGRLIGKRPGLSPDMKALFDAAVANGTVFEINANPHRLDLKDIHARALLEAGGMLAINTDAHAASDFDLLRYGILTARRAWITPDRVVNCFDEDQLTQWRKIKR